MMRRSHLQSGFMLIEVLVSITLLAMLGTLIANGTRLGTRAWGSAERRVADKDEIVLVQNLLRRTILRATPVYASDDATEFAVAFAGEPDKLGFAAPQPGTQFTGAPVMQRFYLARHGSSQALFVSVDQVQTGRGVVLLDHVAELRFGYFGSGQGGTPEWQDNWTGRTRLPELVRVTVRRDDANLQPWPELVVATHATANATCVYDDFATRCRRMLRR